MFFFDFSLRFIFHPFEHLGEGNIWVAFWFTYFSFYPKWRRILCLQSKLKTMIFPSSFWRCKGWGRSEWRVAGVIFSRGYEYVGGGVAWCDNKLYLYELQIAIVMLVVCNLECISAELTRVSPELFNAVPNESPFLLMNYILAQISQRRVLFF